MTDYHRYTFAIGVFEPRRRITVWATCVKDADDIARSELDRRAERAGDEAPVRWDLELISQS